MRKTKWMDNQFIEHQSIIHQTSVKWFFRISFAVYSIGIFGGLTYNKTILEVFVILLMVTLLLYYVFYIQKMTTQLHATQLSVNHPFIGKYTVDLNEINHVELIIKANIPDNRRTFHAKRGTLYRMYGTDGVGVKTKSGIKVFIGSQTAEELYHKLSTHIKLAKLDND